MYTHIHKIYIGRIKALLYITMKSINKSSVLTRFNPLALKPDI